MTKFNVFSMLPVTFLALVVSWYVVVVCGLPVAIEAVTASIDFCVEYIPACE